MGLIGLGQIGSDVARLAKAFEMQIIAYDPYVSSLLAGELDVKLAPLEEVMKSADFISLHVPLLREGESATPTYHLINEATLRKMKPTAMIVNTSRGPVVDEIALARALRENWIAGAALDVYAEEPLSADSPLRDPAIADRCRLLPHFASAARITRLSPDPNKGMAGRCVQGLMDVLEGNYGGDITKMPYVVNKEAFAK